MEHYGAEVVRTPGVPFTDPRHYFHQAAALGRQPGHFYTNQFENTANSQAHYEGTAPEVWRAVGESLDGFVCSCGTGGTIGGFATKFKELKPRIACWIIEPPGSALAPLVAQGAGYVTLGTSPSSGQTRYEADKTVRYAERSPPGIDGVFEGIGIDRVTSNFGRAFDNGLIDG